MVFICGMFLDVYFTNTQNYKKEFNPKRNFYRYNNL